MSKFFIIGGPTFIGKSLFIDEVLRSNSQFVRPHSYTTRPRREDDRRDEYVHLSIDEFNALNSQGYFVTVDEAYGNYYSIAHSSIKEILAAGKIAIKEIHPANHAKLKELLPNTVSVLILPEDFESFWLAVETRFTHESGKRSERLQEDKEFYTALDYMAPPFDIVLKVGIYTSPELLLNHFFSRIHSLLGDSLERTTTIDAVNRTGYDLLAEEFRDDLRVTTRNFHELSIHFLTTELKKYANGSNTVLDLGCGRGYLLPLLRELFREIILVDLSEKMLSFIPPFDGLTKVCASAFDLPVLDKSVDIVVSCLADPFLGDKSLSEVRRILRRDGVFIFVIPSRVWSNALRNADSDVDVMTKFKHSTGVDVPVYSFTYTDAELHDLLTSCGYEIVRFEHAYGKELDAPSKEISPALSDAAQRLGISLDDLPILQMVTVAAKG